MTQSYLSGSGSIILESSTNQYIDSFGSVIIETTDSAPVGATLSASWTEGTETVSVSINVAIVGAALAVAWTEGSETVSIAANSASTNGTITTPVLKNNSGSILASESGVIVNIYNITTGALIVQKTGQASSAGGIVTVSDALIIPATSYAYEVILTANGRRLPTAAAT